MSGLTLTVLAGSALLGCASGVVGAFSILRRRALMGDLLSHAALPGICLAFLYAAGERDYHTLLAGAFLTGVLGVALVTFVCRWTRTKEDAAIGIVLSTFFGGGIVLSAIIQKLPGGRVAGLERYIYGQAANMSRGDVQTIAIVSVAAILVVLLLYKEFKLFSFDAGFARAQGWPTLALDLTMMSVLSLVAVVGVKTVGVLLVPALLIIPGATARFWTNRLGLMLFLAAVIGACMGAAGTLISAGLLTDWLGFDPLAFGRNRAPLPTGPIIVLSGTALFLLSLAIAPERGILSRLLALVRLRRRTAQENLYRTLYELSEPRLPELPVVPLPALAAERSWSPRQLSSLLKTADRAGLIARAPDGVRLTPAGLLSAAAITRAHRLWELYLIQGANIATDHVDRDADSIEHLLPPEIVDALAAELARRGRLPGAPAAVPSSPHLLPAQTHPANPQHA